jgi:hypothetical protein
MWLAVAFTVTTLATSFAFWGQTTGAAGVVAGIGTWALAWPSLEYAVHRSLHRDRGSRHMRHHKTPRDNSLFFVPTRWFVPRVLLYGLLMGSICSAAYSLGLSTGLVAFYIAYEAGHAWTHAHGPPSKAHRRDRITRWHWRHHDAWGVNYGVSTPFWDFVECTASRHTTADLDFTPLAWLLMPLPWVSLALPRRGEGESAKSLDG